MAPTWDLFILIFFAVMTIYGMLLGKSKILGILVNIYIALAVTEVAGELVYNFLSNFSLISANLTASLFGTKVLILVLVTGLLVFKSETSGLDTGSSLSTIQTAIYGFLTAGLILASAFSFMSAAQRMGLDSNFAFWVYQYRAIWVTAPVVLMIASAFRRR